MSARPNLIRSLTPPSEVQRLTDPSFAAYKVLAARAHRSADEDEDDLDIKGPSHFPWANRYLDEQTIFQLLNPVSPPYTGSLGPSRRTSSLTTQDTSRKLSLNSEQLAAIEDLESVKSTPAAATSPLADLQPIMSADSTADPALTPGSKGRHALLGYASSSSIGSSMPSKNKKDTLPIPAPPLLSRMTSHGTQRSSDMGSAADDDELSEGKTYPTPSPTSPALPDGDHDEAAKKFEFVPPPEDADASETQATPNVEQRKPALPKEPTSGSQDSAPLSESRLQGILRDFDDIVQKTREALTPQPGACAMDPFDQALIVTDEDRSPGAEANTSPDGNQPHPHPLLTSPSTPDTQRSKIYAMESLRSVLAKRGGPDAQPPALPARSDSKVQTADLNDEETRGLAGALAEINGGDQGSENAPLPESQSLGEQEQDLSPDVGLELQQDVKEPEPVTNLSGRSDSLSLASDREGKGLDAVINGDDDIDIDSTLASMSPLRRSNDLEAEHLSHDGRGSPLEGDMESSEFLSQSSTRPAATYQQDRPSVTLGGTKRKTSWKTETDASIQQKDTHGPHLHRALKEKVKNLRNALRYQHKPRKQSMYHPLRKQSQSQGPARRPCEVRRPSSTRHLAGHSRESIDTIHTLQRKYKSAYGRLENLLQEALVVTHEAMVQENQRRQEAVRNLPHGCYQYAARKAAQEKKATNEPAGAVSSFCPSQTSSKSGRRSLMPWFEMSGLITPRGDVPHRDKNPHRCLLPGFHCGSVRVVIPERFSSLRDPMLSRDGPELRRVPNKLQKRPPPGLVEFGPAENRQPAQYPGMHSICMGCDGTYDDPALESATPRRRKVQFPAMRCHESGETDKAEEGGATATALGETETGRKKQKPKAVDLRHKRHVTISGDQTFSLSQSRQRKGTARDWPTNRKRIVATVACISTAMIGILIGIYAGMVPGIQYSIADFGHFAVFGNVVFFLGMAVSTFLYWPLPLLHGRRPYILSSMVLAMPLLFPQAVAVMENRSPFVDTWRWCLLGGRAFMGFVVGFASMNFHSMLTDLFGASLMSGNPHQELVDDSDVRRHGGGMGVWLGIWTWCFMASIGVGFLIGAAIIDSQSPQWGFYVSIIILAVVMILNVLCPEVRRSAFRRSVAEVRDGQEISRRLARGEIMMHRRRTGPKWWGEEAWHGMLLSLELMRQPGLAVVVVYLAWTYCQFVLIIVLLGSLTSRFYHLRSTYVGLCVLSVAVGALIGVPFQKGNVFSRARHHQETMNKLALESRFNWSSHLVRRTIFTALLPLTGIGYAVASYGPPVPLPVPVILAACIGLLSCLAISECNGLIMETFDCSDVQPGGMTGQSRRGGTDQKHHKKKNYSSFPRVTAAFAAAHSLGFIFAAGATALGGLLREAVGQRAATGVVAGILCFLTILLSVVLFRFKNVRIIPNTEAPRMERWHDVRRASLRRRESVAPPLPFSSIGGGEEIDKLTNAAMKDAEAALEEAEPYKPRLVVGTPMHGERRVNLLELGAMTRWSEIRKKNRLIDQHVSLNRQGFDFVVDAIEQAVGFGNGGEGEKGEGRRGSMSSRRSSRFREKVGSKGRVEEEDQGSVPPVVRNPVEEADDEDVWEGVDVEDGGEMSVSDESDEEKRERRTGSEEGEDEVSEEDESEVEMRRSRVRSRVSRS